MGSGPGLYGPDSAVWQVHGSVSTIVGAIRALLLQAAHPAALGGVIEHSRYQSDLLGRISGTSRWLTITSFGTDEAIAREAARVNAMHSHVSGDYINKAGEKTRYRASDPRYLLWVHCAFTDSFLNSHLALGYPLARGADAYVSEWSKSATGIGLSQAPQTVAELEATLDDFLLTELSHSTRTDEVVKFIRKPPLGRFSLIFYTILANAAIATLNERQREILGLEKVSRIWIPLCKRLLRLLTYTLGTESPSQLAARNRISNTRVASEN